MTATTLIEATARPTFQLEPLLTHSSMQGPLRGGQLPTALHEAYGSDISIPLRTDRPTVIANFVSTIDGVVSFNVSGQAGGGEVSGFFEPDRFVMGLLRSLSDAVLVGAGTLRDTKKHVWKPSHVHPASAADFARVRQQLGLATEPTTVVVTSNGDIDLTQSGLADPSVPVIVVTTDRGQAMLRRQAPFAPHVDIVTAGPDRVEPSALLDILRDHGCHLVLTEGGPHLFGQLVGAHLVDELFLTLAPQIAGRSDETMRLGLVEGTAFTVAGAPWSQLVDLRRSGSHLFARYRFQETAA
jgi:riboflavin biosynthesis pyrimidine reductase